MAALVPYVAFALFLFVLYLSFLWCLEKSVLHDCGFSWISIMKTCLFKYIENFTTIKIENFQIKNPDIFHISAQNIDCGYSLEPPRRGGSNKYPQSLF